MELKDKLEKNFKKRNLTFKSIYEVIKNSINEAREEDRLERQAEIASLKRGLKVVGKTLIAPGLWTVNKAKAFGAAASRKVHQWAQEDFAKQFNENVNEDRGVSR